MEMDAGWYDSVSVGEGKDQFEVVDEKALERGFHRLRIVTRCELLKYLGIIVTERTGEFFPREFVRNIGRNFAKSRRILRKKLSFGPEVMKGPLHWPLYAGGSFCVGGVGLD